MKNESNSLHKAVKRGDKEAVERLIADGIDVNAIGAGEKRPLRLAAADNHVGIAKILTDAGADPNLDNGIALRVAALYGHKDMVSLLITQGGDVNCGGDDGTPLIKAAEFGHKEVFELLVAHGAKINAKARHGQTALYWAAHHGYKDMVDFLIAKGADVNKTGPDGKSPFYEAASWGHKDIVELLLANGAEINPIAGTAPLCGALRNLVKFEGEQFAASASKHRPDWWTGPDGYKDTVHALIDRGADVNRCDHAGWSPLHFACCTDHADLVKLLIDKGADVNIHDVCQIFPDDEDEYQNITPLHLAAYYGHKEIVQLLMAAGALMDACCMWIVYVAGLYLSGTEQAEVRTVLDFAMLGKDLENFNNDELIEFLRQQGAKTGEELRGDD